MEGNLRDMMAKLRAAHGALAHFNISDSNQLAAIAAAARETGLSVAVGLSEGERAFFPLPLVRSLIDVYNKEGLSLFLNADHTYSFEKAQEAIDAGVDSIVIDGAELSFDDNIALTRRVVEYARGCGREVLVEGELGYIGHSSSVLTELPQGAIVSLENMTQADELISFVERTGVDLMAPAVGNIHGVIQGGNPDISIERISELAQVSPVPLVLHGGSGITDEQFKAAIKAGISMVHINTDLRIVYRQGIERALQEMPEEIAPYKLLAPATHGMKDFIADRIKFFARTK